MNAWKEITRLQKVNARHLKKNFRLGEVSLEYMLEHALEEIKELQAAPDDMDEMADIMACLMHYCVRKGWTQKQINNAILKKLKLRFTENEENICNI